LIVALLAANVCKTAPIVFNNKLNLSFNKCGKGGNPKFNYFPWDAEINAGNEACSGIFITDRAIISSMYTIYFYSTFNK